MMTASFILFAGQIRDKNINYIRDREIYRSDLAAAAFAVSVNDYRFKHPEVPLESIFTYFSLNLPSGYKVRRIEESEREISIFLKEADYVVERSGSPYFGLLSTGQSMEFSMKKKK